MKLAELLAVLDRNAEVAIRRPERLTYDVFGNVDMAREYHARRGCHNEVVEIFVSRQNTHMIKLG